MWRNWRFRHVFDVRLFHSKTDEKLKLKMCAIYYWKFSTDSVSSRCAPSTVNWVNRLRQLNDRINRNTRKQLNSGSWFQARTLAWSSGECWKKCERGNRTEKKKYFQVKSFYRNKKFESSGKKKHFLFHCVFLLNSLNGHDFRSSFSVSFCCSFNAASNRYNSFWFSLQREKQIKIVRQLEYYFSRELEIRHEIFSFTFFSYFFAFSRRVRNWALKFGVSLWQFGRQFTKMNEIKNVSLGSPFSGGAFCLFSPQFVLFDDFLFDARHCFFLAQEKLNWSTFKCHWHRVYWWMWIDRIHKRYSSIVDEFRIAFEIAPFRGIFIDCLDIIFHFKYRMLSCHEVGLCEIRFV